MLPGEEQTRARYSPMFRDTVMMLRDMVEPVRLLRETD